MMKIVLNKKPKKPVIIEGFPGFGLVGTIATEFLIEHMQCELIGEFVYDELQPMAAIHNGKLVKPMAVHYSKKYNVVILQTILNPKGQEWQIAEAIIDVAKKLDSPKIVSIEGVASPAMTGARKPRIYFYGDKKLEKAGLQPINESIVVGVSSCLLLRSKKSVCIFAETNSALPDSNAAAKVIEVLDKYLGLKVDYKPLLKQAKDFETKLKDLMQQTNKTMDESDKKYLSYLG